MGAEGEECIIRISLHITIHTRAIAGNLLMASVKETLAGREPVSHAFISLAERIGGHPPSGRVRCLFDLSSDAGSLQKVKGFLLAPFVIVYSLCSAVGTCRAQEPATAVHPKGTFIRPVDGIQHPDLNAAWEAYEAAIEDTAKAVQAAIDKKTKAAQAKGDLAAVDRDQKSRQSFDDHGILPGNDSLRPDVNRAGTAFRKANKKLLDSYETVIALLTQQGKIPEAKAARDERGGLESSLPFPPIPNVPEPLFDGTKWDGWGQGWGERKQHEIDAGSVRLSNNSYFRHERVLDGDIVFELEVRNRDWERAQSIVQFGFQTDSGACLVRIPAGHANGQLLRGRGEIIFYDHANNQTTVLEEFPCQQPASSKWHSGRFLRTGDNFSLFLDGRQIVRDKSLPEQLRRNVNLHIGVSNGAADFKNLRVTASQ